MATDVERSVPLGERVASLETRDESLATRVDLEKLRGDLRVEIHSLESRLTWKLLLWTGVWTGVLVGIFKWG